jgi:hypothetical protein
LVKLIGMAVEKGIDRLELGDGVFDVHDGRLVGLDHRPRAGGVALVAASWAAGSRD